MSHRQVHGICTILFATACALSATVAVADDRGPIDQDFQMSLGVYFMSFDTQVRLDGQVTQTGTDVNWENEFGLKDADRFRVDAQWRFARRHKLRLMYFENNRSHSTVLTRDINFGDTTFPVSLEVGARLDTRIIELAYEYAFLRRENLELSGSFGIHNLRVEAGLGGKLSTPGGVTGALKKVATGDGPLPVLGLHFLWNMGGHFYFDGLGQFFFAEIDNYKGHLEDFKAGVTWFPVRNVGIGVGYNKLVTRLDINKSSFNGRLKLQYGGPQAYFTVGF
jgi:hypothetical protein